MSDTSRLTELMEKYKNLRTKLDYVVRSINEATKHFDEAMTTLAKEYDEHESDVPVYTNKEAIIQKYFYKYRNTKDITNNINNVIIPKLNERIREIQIEIYNSGTER